MTYEIPNSQSQPSFPWYCNPHSQNKAHMLGAALVSPWVAFQGVVWFLLLGTLTDCIS